jgi:hypothetical protein
MSNRQRSSIPPRGQKLGSGRTDVEYHKYPDVGRGFRLGAGTRALKGWSINA